MTRAKALYAIIVNRFCGLAYVADPRVKYAQRAAAAAPLVRSPAHMSARPPHPLAAERQRLKVRP